MKYEKVKVYYVHIKTLSVRTFSMEKDSAEEAIQNTKLILRQKDLRYSSCVFRTFEEAAEYANHIREKLIIDLQKEIQTLTTMTFKDPDPDWGNS